MYKYIVLKIVSVLSCNAIFKMFVGQRLGSLLTPKPLPSLPSLTPDVGALRVTSAEKVVSVLPGLAPT